jgi:parvulin-like peptidyl-prolyl isomerase
MHRLVSVIALATLLLPGALVAAKPADLPNDVIAKVGDQPITFGQINTMLNSSAVVGVSIPALGTPQRDTVRIALLDKVVSANLLYLDALRQGVDQGPGYTRDMQRFENGILSGLYVQRELSGEIAVTEEEIQAFYEESVVPGTELTDDGRAQIEAALRKRKADLDQDMMPLRMALLRDEVGVTLHEDRLGASGDEGRSDDVVVAEVGDEVITWGEVKTRLQAAGKGAVRRDILAMEEEGRLAALRAEADTRLLARKARESGLDRDPVFLRRVGEYRKTRLVNLHRAALARRYDPSEAQLEAWFEANRARISVPEARKVQMVVVETEEEAAEIKQKILDGDMTLFEAARDRSIDPGAKQNLGELGWILPGQGQPALDEATFALGPNEIAGPIETPAGWHLLKVTDVREGQYDDIADPGTRKRARRLYIHEKLDDYVVDLRRNHFDVEVYEDKLIQLAQAEADMVEQLSERAAEPGSETEKRVGELQQLIRRWSDEAK